MGKDSELVYHEILTYVNISADLEGVVVTREKDKSQISN